MNFDHYIIDKGIRYYKSP